MNRIGRHLVILAALGMLLSTHPAAQSDKPSPPEPPTLDKLDRVHDLEAAQSDLEKAVTLVNEIALEKWTQCVRAFGDPKFCDCLRDNLPVKVSFLSYIQTVTSTK